jgi:hypothetical protein
MKNINYINTDLNTFLIQIKFKSNNNVFICSADQIGSILRTHNNSGKNIVIKQFCNHKLSFKKISKADLKTFVAWDTETRLELEKINFI